MIANVLGYKGTTFHHWVRDVICQVDEPPAQEELHANDLYYEDRRGHRHTLDTPIFRPEHVGERMAIDEKHLGDEYYTLLTNSDTGKIAFCGKCHDAGTLSLMLMRLGEEVLSRVRAVTRDLSPMYAQVIHTVFPQAVQVADKFHVVRLAVTAMQDLRLDLKRQERRRQERERKAHRKAYRENELLPKSQRKEMGKVYHPELLPNGLTTVELLDRSRYLLYKYPSDWTPSQRARARLLFERFPQLAEAYRDVCDFRLWYRPSHSGDDRVQKHNQAKAFIASLSPKRHFRDFASTLSDSLPEILNYFSTRLTNAIAESTNARLQMAIIKNRGSRDTDFFFYRVAHFL